MPGLYLHIPFCKQACHYCNFHFSTSLARKEELVDALLLELELQQAYLRGATIDTIYLGGGTPSLLSLAELDRLFEKIAALHPVAEDAEITLEANPDDLSVEKITALAQTPINRLSIGIQSFAEADLQFMNRAHNATEAHACLENALAAGFTDLTIDLIYGTPTLSDAQWAKNMDLVFDYAIPHVSAYALTVEPKTALAYAIKTGKAPPVTEEKTGRHFEMLMAAAKRQGYVHYEISNFALPNRYARHNSNYWRGVPYLGIGPSAHSFDGTSRQWNVANNAKYLRAISEGTIPFEQEILTPAQRYNEYLMTGLRTIWGVAETRLAALDASFLPHFRTAVQPFIEQNLVRKEADAYVLTDAGKLLADGIASDLFIIESD